MARYDRISLALLLGTGVAACGDAARISGTATEVRSVMTWRADTDDSWQSDCRPGDCEDFALCTIARLQARGIHATIGVYTDPVRGRHAVAVTENWIVDNGRMRPRGHVGFDWEGELRDGRIWMIRLRGRDVPPVPVRRVETAGR